MSQDKFQLLIWVSEYLFFDILKMKLNARRAALAADSDEWVSAYILVTAWEVNT